MCERARRRPEVQAASARRQEAPLRIPRVSGHRDAVCCGEADAASATVVAARGSQPPDRYHLARGRGCRRRICGGKTAGYAGAVTHIARLVFLAGGAHALVCTRPLVASSAWGPSALSRRLCVCPAGHRPVPLAHPRPLFSRPRLPASLALGMCEPPAQGVESAKEASTSPPGKDGDRREGTTTERAMEPPVDTDGNKVFSGLWLAGVLKQNRYLNKWLEDELEEMETSVGYDIPGQGQIVEYDPAFLSKVGWMVNLRGTVFSIPFIYWQFLFMLLFALAYAWAAGPMPAVIDVMGMQGVACSSGGRLRLPILKPQTFALSLVGGLLGFLLSLFNTNGLDRWWKTRDCLGAWLSNLILHPAP